MVDKVLRLKLDTKQAEAQAKAFSRKVRTDTKAVREQTMQLNIAKAQINIKKLRASMKGLKGNAKIIVRAEVNKAQAKIRDMNAELKKMQGRATFGSRIKKSIIGTFVNPFTIGIAAVALFGKTLKSIVTTSAGFEKQMSNVKAITGATVDEMDRLSKSALDMGKKTKFTAKQVGELQVEYGKLGFSVKEIENATEATLNLAAATDSGLAESAMVAGSTLRAFGLDATEMGRVTDVMALSFTSVALDLENFKESMKLVAPIAKAAGVSLEDTTALLGVLADNGLRGSMAGTALRRIMVELVATGKPFKEALADLTEEGITLSSAMDDVGRRAQTALLILGENEDQIKELGIAFEAAGGSAKKMADIQLDNFSGSVTKLSSAWDALKVSIGGSNGKLRQFVDFMTGVLNLITGGGGSVTAKLVELGIEIGDLGEQIVAVQERIDKKGDSKVLLEYLGRLQEKYTELTMEQEMLQGSAELLSEKMEFLQQDIEDINNSELSSEQKASAIKEVAREMDELRLQSFSAIDAIDGLNKTRVNTKENRAQFAMEKQSILDNILALRNYTEAKLIVAQADGDLDQIMKLSGSLGQLQRQYIKAAQARGSFSKGDGDSKGGGLGDKRSGGSSRVSKAVKEEATALKKTRKAWADYAKETDKLRKAKIEDIFKKSGKAIEDNIDKIAKLKDEIDGLTQDSEDIGTDIASRVIEIENELKDEDISADDKKDLEEELQLAKSSVTKEQIDEARAYEEASDTERLLAKQRIIEEEIEAKRLQYEQEQLLLKNNISIQQELQSKYVDGQLKNFDKLIAKAIQLNAITGGTSGSGIGATTSVNNTTNNKTVNVNATVSNNVSLDSFIRKTSNI